MTLTTTETTAAAWRAAEEAGDADAAAACLAEQVVFISPLTAEFRFHGRAQVHDVLTAAFEVFSDVRCHTEVGDQATRVLFFHGMVGNQPVEEAQLLRFDEAGLISEMTFFGRPLPALTEVLAQLGPKLVRRQGRRGLAAVIGAATKPLAVLTRLGERRLVPLANPNRP